MTDWPSGVTGMGTCTYVGTAGVVLEPVLGLMVVVCVRSSPSIAEWTVRRVAMAGGGR